MDITIDLIAWAQIAVLATFLSLSIRAGVGIRHAGPADRWVAAAFAAIAVGLLALWVPGMVGGRLPDALTGAWLSLILLCPYLLLRFTATFQTFPRWLESAAAGALLVAVVFSLLLPVLPQGGQVPYIVIALGYWLPVSLVSIVSLWRSGHGEPTLARRRMRLMSTATAVLTLALLTAALVRGGDALTGLAIHAAALGSGLAFGLAFAPPRALRLLWRGPEARRLQEATSAVLRATTPDEVAQQLLPPTTRIVGGRGAALVTAAGEVIATHGEVPGTDGRSAPSPAVDDSIDRKVVALGEGRGQLLVWTSRYSPFFGRDERDLVETIGALASLALERCDLLEEERTKRTLLEEAQRSAEVARAAAEQANLAKSEFLSRMSHELRTPLNAVLGFGQLLEVSEQAPAEREAIDHILKAGRHLLELINDVLDLSRIETGALAISLEPVHAAELIGDTLPLIRPLAETRSIRLDIDEAGCDTYVKTDRQRCRQVLLNLLSNAVKYNYDGGHIDVRCSRSQDALRITVRDSGPGIDPASQPRLFEPFERLGAERTSVEGTGLGLALSKQLIERMGGTIGVESAPLEGSTFWIDLPLTAAPLTQSPPTPEPAAPQRTMDRTLLLVEDNLANLRLIEAMLKHRPGIHVLPAMQGKLAIELACEHRPDVVVLDLHLPDLSGHEVLHRLRADPRTRGIPVVIASADASTGQVRRLKEAGAFDYLTKPIDLQQFLATIDTALAHRDAGSS